MFRDASHFVVNFSEKDDVSSAGIVPVIC